MKQFFLAVLLTSVIVSCTRVPVTNRKQFRLLQEEQLILMADTAYRDFLATAKVLPHNDPRTATVKRVGGKIQSSVIDYLTRKNALGRIRGFTWEFNVVDDPTINAWCMPGGKVVVYTGILNLATDDTLLAVIMGHEIAHAIARHGNERMSQQMAIQGVGRALGGAMSDPVKRNIFLQSYGIGSALGILSYSRKHETESDKMGLVFMYLAGYNPSKAIDFWKKMAANGAAVPEFLSTHPSDETRIKDITDFLPLIPKYAQ
ncbi:MAG TPA: peptidase M48 [Flavobacteriales bacterium]|nr:peptidase M48 [Flavobacteriales bacterium]HRE74871.1 M48 family metallopeptidase [Flavobacteriales bacterium]HRJ34761.1 M48 family metallopeptidase [Flavobacteriales bacterium]HRJ37905.1 M48 family metallopeptidase [Flavobacteriales bacterium]